MGLSGTLLLLLPSATVCPVHVWVCMCVFRHMYTWCDIYPSLPSHWLLSWLIPQTSHTPLPAHEGRGVAAQARRYTEPTPPRSWRLVWIPKYFSPTLAPAHSLLLLSLSPRVFVLHVSSPLALQAGWGKANEERVIDVCSLDSRLIFAPTVNGRALQTCPGVQRSGPASLLFFLSNPVYKAALR